MSGAMQYIMPALQTVGGAASEFFAPGNPAGIAAMGSGIGGAVGQATGGNAGGSIGSTLGGMGGMFGGGGMGGGSMVPGAMDPTMLASGDPNSLSAMMSMGGGGASSMGASPPMANPVSMPGVSPAMFGGSGPGMGGDPTAATGYDRLDQARANYLDMLTNPSWGQVGLQSLGAMGPVGAALIQQRQQQQLAAMSHQAPTANLQGGPNPVPQNMGGGGMVNPTSPISGYAQILSMLSR